MHNRLALIGELFVLSFQDCVRIFRQQWPALLVLVATGLIALLLVGAMAPMIRTQLGRSLAITLAKLAYLWAMAPYLVALYRFVATGENNRPESIRGTAAVTQFFAWSAVLIFLSTVPALLQAFSSPSGPTYYVGARPPASPPSLSFAPLAALAILIFNLRTITLLPAAAFGEQASIRRSMAETKGSFWFVLGAFCLPVIAIAIVGALLGKVAGELIAGNVAGFVILAVTMLLYLLVSMSISVRLYQMLRATDPEPATPAE